MPSACVVAELVEEYALVETRVPLWVCLRRVGLGKAFEQHKRNFSAGWRLVNKNMSSAENYHNKFIIWCLLMHSMSM